MIRKFSIFNLTLLALLISCGGSVSPKPTEPITYTYNPATGLCEATVDGRLLTIEPTVIEGDGGGVSKVSNVYCDPNSFYEV